MAINAYLVYNITKKNDEIFTSQIKTWVNSFKKEGVELHIVDNINALDEIKTHLPVDFVLFWDKDVALMYELMNLGIHLFNNVDAVRLSDDKAYTYAHLLKYKVRTPITVVVPLTFYENVAKYFKEIKELVNKHNISYPFVVKERRNSLGFGVYLIHNDKEFKDILDKKGNLELIVQEYIDYEPGVDYRVFVVNHRPKAVVTRINKNDFRSNVELGGKMHLITNPDKELLHTALKASLAVKLDFGGVDLVKGKDNHYYVLEVNSNARTATIDKISKTPLTDSIVKYILNNI